MNTKNSPIKNYSLWLRIRKELALLLLLYLILLFFVGINVVYFTSVSLMYALLLLLKRNRIVRQIRFDNEQKHLVIQYYYFVFLKGTEQLPYNRLAFKMSMKRYGFGAATQTLEIFKGRTLCCEIRKSGNWSWPETEIQECFNRLSRIKKDSV